MLFSLGFYFTASPLLNKDTDVISCESIYIYIYIYIEHNNCFTL